jgi:hypothetical protein
MLRFEDVLTNFTGQSSPSVRRAKVPGGWLVIIAYGEWGICFVPDPEHKWDGSSLP